MKSHICAVFNLNTAGMAALQHVTRLDGRPADHRDIKSLDYALVSLNALLRNEIKTMSLRAQQAYTSTAWQHERGLPVHSVVACIFA